MEPNKPVQVSPEWWMAYSPTGHAYYHNTVTNETTWSTPAGVSDPTSAKSMDQQAMAFLTTNQPAVPQAQQHHQQQPEQSYQPVADQGGQPQISASSASDISVNGSGNIPAAWVTFEQMQGQVPQHLIQPMLQAGFQSPSPIQQYAWPIACAGRDVIAVAKTGSGKTLGFLIPACTKMLGERISGAPVMLVMAPTRELAVQIDSDAKKFCGPAGIVTALAYGGAPKGPQLADIRRRPHLLTGTPGRLNDFIEGRMINLESVRFLCMDEADRMLDMGFEPQIRKVITNIPRSRQTMMFTATWPKEIRRLAQEFFKEPVEVRIGNADELQANTDIDQQVVICGNLREKETKLVEVLRKAVLDGQIIIFTKTKRMCDTLMKSLCRMGVKCEAIHGDRDQRERDMALESFKSGHAKILVATDVAARGLDVKAITMVVNFDPANNAEDYVHRIGRTGRAGRKGTAVTLLTQDEAKSAQQIMQVMEKTGKPIPPELARLASQARPERERRGGKGGGSRSRSRGAGGRRGGKGKGGGGGRSRSRSRGRGRSRSRSGGRGGSGGGGGGGGGCGYGGDGYGGGGGCMGGYPGMMPGMGGMPGMPGMGGMPGMMPGMGMPTGYGMPGMPGMPGMMPGMGGCMPGMGMGGMPH